MKTTYLQAKDLFKQGKYYEAYELAKQDDGFDQLTPYVKYLDFMYNTLKKEGHTFTTKGE